MAKITVWKRPEHLEQVEVVRPPSLDVKPLSNEEELEALEREHELDVARQQHDVDVRETELSKTETPPEIVIKRLKTTAWATGAIALAGIVGHLKGCW